jgi:hypothetical protein
MAQNEYRGGAQSVLVRGPGLLCRPSQERCSSQNENYCFYAQGQVLFLTIELFE